jgi:hypothetical protein
MCKLSFTCSLLFLDVCVIIDEMFKMKTMLIKICIIVSIFIFLEYQKCNAQQKCGVKSFNEGKSGSAARWQHWSQLLESEKS